MRFANLDDWLAWQETLHPSEIDLGLDRVAMVLARLELGDPGFKVISVAGTNGKGSCVAMLDAIYRSAGYAVGTYTSPHIKKYNERITVNGSEISDHDLCEAFEKIDQCRGEISLTYFEFGTLAAIVQMVKARVDIAILEVGLGGRLDAVNVLDADVAVITSIGLDHQGWLGNDRETIAIEKAGIARSGRPLVCGDRNPPETLINYLQEIKAIPYFIDQDFFFEAGPISNGVNSWHWRDKRHQRSTLPMPALKGEIQLQNASTVLMVLELFMPEWPVSQADIREGLASVVIPGRFQVIPGEVTMIIDVAHNTQAAEALAHGLKAMPCTGKTLAVFGCMSDKDLENILAVVNPLIDHWFVSTLDVPRGRDSSEIAQAIKKLDANKPVSICETINMAKETAVKHAKPGDRVVAFGSFLVASEIL